MKRTTATEGADPETSNSRVQHPLPLHLDLVFGKGFLSAEDVPLADWLTLESLRMEIPDLSFPFEGGGGVERFQQTRCKVRDIALSVDESGLASRLRRATSSLDEFEEMRIRFQEDALHVSLRLDAFGTETAFSFRVALVPPEPPRADEIHLSLYDYRWFGPLPYPARLLAFEWLTGVLDHPAFATSGRGRPYQVGIAGDMASFRPFKMLLLEVFPKRGWKLPDLSEVVLDDVRMAPGELTIRASGEDDQWTSGDDPVEDLRESREGRRALAAYESKDLFAPADEALFDGEIDEALELLSSYREQYGLHPHLASRMLDCLLADPSGAQLAEARAICEELVADNPDDLRAHLARPLLAMISEGEDAALEPYEELSDLLRERDDTPDWILSELVVADLLDRDDPDRAADRLREVLRTAPHSRPVLERLRTLYRRLEDWNQLEDVLKRLTSIYDDRERLRETYLELARHLMHRTQAVGEARHYLQKALAIDSDDLEALEALGESYTLGDKPMRAVKALASAARTAEARGESTRARELQFRVARLWRDELDDPGQALLSARRAIATTETERGPASSLDRPRAIEYARQLEFAADLCEELDRGEEALGHWAEVVNLLERLVGADDVPEKPVGEVESPDPSSPVGRLAEAHRRQADLYLERDRSAAAEQQWERVLELDPADTETADRLARHYWADDRTDDLVELLQWRLRTESSPSRSAALHRRLADVYEEIGDDEKAEQHLDNARRFAERIDEDPPENPWRKHEAETAPVVESSVEEPPPPEEQTDDSEPAAETDSGPASSPDLVPPEPDATDRGERETPVSDGSAEQSGSEPDLDDLEEQLDEARRRYESDVEETLGEAGGTDPGLGTDLDSSDFDTTSETRRLPDSSSVVEHEQRIERSKRPTPSAEGPGSADGEQEEQGEDPSLEEFRDEYRELLEAGEEAGADAPSVDPTAPAEEESPSEASDAGDELEVPAPDSLSEPASDADDVDESSPEGPAGDAPSDLRETLQAHRPPSPEERIERARASDDPNRLADVLGDILEAHERSSGSVDLDADRALEIRRELAELLYYELEDADEARPHLEALRRDDPEGYGSDSEVLRALETIYERSGETERRISILEARLAETDDPEMADNFRLLLARLHWREQEEAETAERLLRETLETSPDHEGAHRLLAEIRRDQEDWEAAAHHLERVLELAGSGLDAVELARDYADLLREHLDAPEEAADYYTSVLEEAPGDARALEGLQSCRTATGDWRAYLEGLGHELGLLLGRTSALGPEEMAELEERSVPDTERVPASEILVEAAEVATSELGDDELARRLYGGAHRVWPEFVEALERRIELDRSLDKPRHLAEDLERYARALLDPNRRIDALVEAADIWRDLGDLERAIESLEQALSVEEGEGAVGPKRSEQLRETLDSLREETDH